MNKIFKDSNNPVGAIKLGDVPQIGKIKLVDCLNSKRKILNQKLMCIGLLMISSSAFAKSGQSGIEYALDQVTQWLTDDVGLLAGTLAIVGAGFLGLTGRMPMAFLKTTGISLGIIYSAAFLAGLVTGR